MCYSCSSLGHSRARGNPYFLRILADQAGNLLNIDELASSVGIAKETVYNYLGKKKRSNW